jgi:hypothetical protein
MKNYVPRSAFHAHLPTIPPYLRAIRVGTGIGHREQSRLVVLQLKVLIYEPKRTAEPLQVQ